MITHQHTLPQAPQRVVLLGARGFIGRAIHAQLQARSIPALPLTSSELDLSLPDAPAKLARLIGPADAVVMLSALTPDKGRDIATLMKNLGMMQHLVKALEVSGCAHLVYFSSDAVYDTAIARVTEGTPAAPQDLYGTMHRTREIMAGAVKAPLLILRPTLVYGDGDPHSAYGPNRFRRVARKDGKISLFGNGEELRDHIHVGDVAALTLRCLVQGSTGVLNAATGVSTSFHDVARMVAGHFALPIPVVATARANPVTHRHYDVTNLVKAFPDFRFTGLREGIAGCHSEISGAP
jgi:UDP-glucose 4-epimerase